MRREDKIENRDMERRKRTEWKKMKPFFFSFSIAFFLPVASFIHARFLYRRALILLGVLFVLSSSSSSRRAWSYQTGFLIRKTDEGCLLLYLTQSDPRGWVPAWLGN